MFKNNWTWIRTSNLELREMIKNSIEKEARQAYIDTRQLNSGC